MRSRRLRPVDGLIDEVLSTVVRSDAWLKATWRSLSALAIFLAAGAEETKAEVA